VPWTVLQIFSGTWEKVVGLWKPQEASGISREWGVRSAAGNLLLCGTLNDCRGPQGISGSLGTAGGHEEPLWAAKGPRGATKGYEKSRKILEGRDRPCKLHGFMVAVGVRGGSPGVCFSTTLVTFCGS
jgi:hypothetical protein